MRRLLVCLLAATMASPASAHMLAPSLFELRERDGGPLEVEWRTPVFGTPGIELRPVLPAGCAPIAEATSERFEAVSVTRWRVACNPAGLVGRRLTVAGVVENRADVLLRVELADGRRFRSVLRADRPEFVVPERERALDVVASYIHLGVEHIVAGLDHLLFVLGLVLLIDGRRRLLWTLTAFTLGHSVTLSLAALGFVQVPQALAEVAIAATIFVLAVELAQPAASPTLLRRRPAAMAALFGLLHGLGFAAALSEIGLPAGDIPLALLSFNLGIEVGQIAFVAVVLLAGGAARGLRLRWPTRLRLAPAYAIGSLAAFWFLGRLSLVVGL